MHNKMKITILKDGSIKVENGSFDPAVHMEAEALNAEIERLAGGDTTVESTGHDHAHGHIHTHEDGHTHQH